jgi:hypothetical protein
MVDMPAARVPSGCRADYCAPPTVQLGRYGLLIVTGNNTVCPAVAGLGLAVGTGDGAYTAVVGAVGTAAGTGAAEASGTGAVTAGMAVMTGEEAEAVEGAA